LVELAQKKIKKRCTCIDNQFVSERH